MVISEFFYTLPFLIYMAVIVVGFVMFFVDGAKARRFRRKRNLVWSCLFTTAITWIALTIYSGYAIMVYASSARGSYRSTLPTKIILFGPIVAVLLAMIIAFIVAQIRAKIRGSKAKPIFTSLFVASLATVFFVLYVVALYSYTYSVYGGEIFP